MKKTESKFNNELHEFALFMGSKKAIRKKFEVNLMDWKQKEEHWIDSQKRNDLNKWLVVAFPWRKTPEGFEFWQDVNNKFLQFIKQ